MSDRLISILLTLPLLAFGLTGCDSPSPPAAPPPPLASELVFYNWIDDMPQAVLDDFTREYGVAVRHLTFESPEEAYANLSAREVYDVVVVESRKIPSLVREGLLAEINHGNLPNFKNIAANFRDLAYDPGNRHSAPYNWGTVGLVVRGDLVAEPVTRWSDLWDPRYAGRVGFWFDMPREVIAIALKSLGYSGNSEAPDELEVALRHLLALKPHMLRLEEFDSVSATGVMASGQAVLAMAWAQDALEGREQNPAIVQVLPEEGALLWGDNFVIPANSPNQHTAELLVNFLLRPDVNARIANENRYATPNEAALPLIDPEILNDPIIFPPNADLQNAELILPLSPEGEQRYTELWARFMTVDLEGEQ
jgi:spermidine/putrescine transport system substrate-binding protein